MNARDYYFTFIAPDEKNKNYQEITEEMHGPILKGLYTELFPKHDYREFQKEYNESDTLYSNDILINYLIADLISRSDQHICKRLEKVFVAKKRNYKSDAYAIPTSDYIDGDLVFFNVGLSDACFQYSIVYAELCALQALLAVRGKHGDEQSELNKLLLRHVVQISEAQENWSLNGDQITIEQHYAIRSLPNVEAVAANFAQSIDVFILCHELSHHLLGHYGGDDTGKVFLDLIPNDLRSWKIQSIVDHRMEVEADMLALILQCGTITHSYSPNSLRDYGAINKYILGSLLFFTILGQIDENPSKPCATHPSTLDRYINCLNISNYLVETKKQDYLEPLHIFQTFLFATQGKGLGEYL